MRITVLTLFPEMYGDFLRTSIIGRAVERGLVSVDFVQIRDFAEDRYRHVDDTPFGGGAGMVMKCGPAAAALESVRTESSYVVMMNPSGSPYSQKKAREYAGKEHLILLCGHYEGIDARMEEQTDDIISIGDFILTGGEIASMAVMDSVIRLLKGSIRSESAQEESYEGGLLEYPQYTKPAEWRGMKVPDVLLSGNHQKIREFRKIESLRRTKKYRPDLFAKYEFTEEDKKMIRRYHLEDEFPEDHNGKE